MTYNTDSFGNAYHNGFFREIVNGGNTLNDSQTATTTAISMGTFYGTRFTDGRYLTMVNPLEIRVAPFSSSNYRFDFRGAGTNPNVRTVDTGVATGVALGFGLGSADIVTTSTATSTHVVMDQSSIFIAVFNYNINGIPSLLGFGGCGWVDEPLFTTELYRYANIFMVGFAPGAWSFRRPTQKNSSTPETCLVSGGANYTVTCLSGSNSGTLKATNLALLGTSPTNYMSGYIPTSLLKVTGVLTAGRLYQIDGVGKGYANTNPNTEQNKYVALAPFGTGDWLVQRVFVEV